MRLPSTKNLFTTLASSLVLLGSLAFSMQAHAAASVLIWPIDPVIEDHQQAAAIWVENLDSKPVTLQVRIMKWGMEHYREIYSEEQDGVAISPPMATLPPGKRQLIRLIKRARVPAGQEAAYRIIIDEIPQPENRMPPAAQDAATSSFGVKLQMRYSIPLFVSGSGVWTKEDPARPRDPASAAQPALRWHTEIDAGKQWLVVHNTGPVHAKLTKMRIHADGNSTELAPALFGYVLPGATMRWPLDGAVRLQGKPQLQATVNGKDGVSIEAD